MCYLTPLIERKYRFAVRPKKHRPGRTRGGFKVELRFQNKLVYVTFTTASPNRKRVRSEHLRRPIPTKQYWNNLKEYYQEVGQIDRMVCKTSNASFFLDKASLLFKRYVT